MRLNARHLLAAAVLSMAPVSSAFAKPNKPASNPPSSPGGGNTPSLSTVKCADYLGAIFKDFTATGCSGFWVGNEISGPVPAAPVKTALQGLGLADPKYVEKTEEFGKTGDFSYVNFDAPLYGVTVVGIHWGGGVFNSIPGAPNGLGTAFFVFDAGTSGVDKLYFSKTWSQSLSNAALYSTGKAPECQGTSCGGGGNQVPEPSTFGLMAAGLFGLAAGRRRRPNS